MSLPTAMLRAWTLALLVPCLGIIAAACDAPPAAPAAEPRSQALRVAVRESPTTYHVEADGAPAGFEFDLITEFARDAGLEVVPVVLPGDNEIFRQLRDGQVDVAIGWLSPPRESPGEFRATRPYASSRMVVVQHEASLAVDATKGLAGRPVHVAAGSHLADRLYRLRADVPELQLVERPDPGGLELLRAVAEGRIDLVVTDRPVFDIAQNFHPELQASLSLGDVQPISWLFSVGAGDALFARAQDFLARAESNGLVARLKDRYFGHVDRLDPAMTVEFLARARTVLPKFQALFKQAQIRSGIDWRLIAALAYQESKWEPLATSPTNVRGIMMLTEDTADRLGVTDRLDPQQSILGGATYLADLRETLPAGIAEPDRTWLALAAYNLGMGHLNAGRRIAKGMNIPSDRWHEMKRVLPLMARPEYYNRLKSGRARGGEAVVMVENVRAYFDILRRYLPAYDPLVQREEDAIRAKAKAMNRAPRPGSGGPGLRPPPGTGFTAPR